MHQKNVISVIIGTLKILVLNMNHKAINFNDAATVSSKGSDYRIHFWYMSKDDAISILNNSNLNEKSKMLQIFFHYM